MPTLSLDGVFTADALVTLLTLTGLEIVLGIDNIIFIAILVGKLPEAQRRKARQLGLFLAMFMRIALLFAISAVMALDRYRLLRLPWNPHEAAEPAAGPAHAPEAGAALAHAADAAAAAAPLAAHAENWFTGKDLVLLLGGLFLIAKSVYEIHHKIEDAGGEGHHGAVPPPPGEVGVVRAGAPARVAPGFGAAIVQILMLDLVFSLDSVITAVGMARQLAVMVAAVVIAVGVMMAFSGVVSRFVDRHPTIKMLALSFLIMIGVMLVADATGWHVPKAYIYCSMAFALGVEFLNIWARSRAGRARGGAPAH